MKVSFAVCQVHKANYLVDEFKDRLLICSAEVAKHNNRVAQFVNKQSD